MDEIVHSIDQMPKDIRLPLIRIMPVAILIIHSFGHHEKKWWWQTKWFARKCHRTKFGSFDKFQDEFNTAAKKVFGSGWAWLAD